MKKRQFTIFSFALVIALSSFGLFLRSALTPRYSRSEMIIGEKRNHKLIVSFPADWIADTHFGNSLCLSHGKSTSDEGVFERGRALLFHQDWKGIEIVVNVSKLEQEKSIEQNLRTYEQYLKESYANPFKLVIRDLKHPLGVGEETAISMIPPVGLDSSHAFTRSVDLFCQLKGAEDSVQISMNFHCRDAMKARLESVAKDILSRMKIEPIMK